MTKPAADTPPSLDWEYLVATAHRLDQAIASYQTCAGCDGKLILDAQYLVAGIFFAVKQADRTN